ncbi:MAG: ATP-binding cassette domain-containing protein, partial [Candidatus Binatia bacterium]
ENLDLYADLHGVLPEEQRERYPRLLEMTALAPFTDRLAGRLSGGMKQKLGLACTLIRSPELLLLDEPTVGVDPVSRRELWEIIRQLVNDESLTVLLSTSYLDEAEHCGYVLVLHNGKVLAQGSPHEVSALAKDRTFLVAPPPGQKARILQAQLLEQASVVDAVPEGGQVRFVTQDRVKAENGKMTTEIGSEKLEPSSIHLSSFILRSSRVPPRFEDGFMVLLRQTVNTATPDKDTRRKGDKEKGSGAQGDKGKRRQGETPVVQVHDLVRRFGNFTAVDHIGFEVSKGEIFGLLGPNGAGKTTTFRMLCGLLPATSGTLRVAGVDLRRARASARQRIGYVAQKFSLY